MNRPIIINCLGILAAVAVPGRAELLPVDGFRVPVNCSQIVLVTSSSWPKSNGTIQAFETDERGRWRTFGQSSDVRLGRSGMAWGRGVSSYRGLPGPHKREGDDKAPAGLFRLSFAFGYSAQPPETRMHYVPISKTTICVDDPGSRYYNQMLDSSRVTRPDWHSAENMQLRDDRYTWGVFVMHNTPPQSGCGSCIFLHVWKDSATSTSGCTAMPERVMLSLIKWLDPARHPMLVQMPRDVYRAVTKVSNLPQIEGQRRR